MAAKKVVSMTRQQLLEGSQPEDTWEVVQCTPAEAVDMAMRLLGQVIQNMLVMDQEVQKQQATLIQSMVNNVPGAKEYADAYMSAQKLLIKQ